MYKKIFTISIAIIAVLQLHSQIGGVSISTTGAPADPSAGLDIQSTDKGLLIPRMTTVQRNAIVSPAQALQIFNVTTNCLEIYISSNWHNIYCDCALPVSPTSGTLVPGQTQIEWNWDTVVGATGYKYNTINDYNSATDNSANTAYTQTGLTCNTAYALYVWAYNACGCSSPVTLSQSTTVCPSPCGTSTVSFTYHGSNVIYGTVIGQNNTCWLDRNLGAIQVATAYNDIDGYGDLFQWGRLDDGHQVRNNNNSTTTLSSNTVPGHSSFIVINTTTLNWYTGTNPDNLWQGVSGINNPCPAGWRLPTETELDNERSAWASIPGGGNNYNGAIASALRLPAAGYRSYSNGLIYNEGSYGYYWSSTFVSGDINARNLYFTSSNAAIQQNVRSHGKSVRCFRD